MIPYFICSLPRSRTAWLANFLSYGPSHCFHEPFNEHFVEDLRTTFLSTGKEYVGISDSLSTLFIADLLDTFPEAKLVLIRRPVLEVDQRLTELGLPCRDLLFHLDLALNAIESKYNPLVVNFHDFDAPGIWNFLMPEVPLNSERTKMLENFNITVPKSVSVRKGIEFLERHQRE